MAKIKWKDQKEINTQIMEVRMEQDRAKQIQQVKEATQEKLRGKQFKNLPTKDKDYLLESIAIIMGLIEEKK